MRSYIERSMEEKEENQSFKVVDKRRFTSEGDSSEGSSGEVHSGSEVSGSLTDSKEQTKVASDERAASDRRSAHPQEINFSAFLMGIYTQTLIFMGDIPNPETSLTSVNLEAGKQNIDILSIIEDKTKGNLSPEEEHLLKEILTTLRLQFVKKTKA
jgi:hypothetical protein